MADEPHGRGRAVGWPVMDQVASGLPEPAWGAPLPMPEPVADVAPSQSVPLLPEAPTPRQPLGFQVEKRMSSPAAYQPFAPWVQPGSSVPAQPMAMVPMPPQQMVARAGYGEVAPPPAAGASHMFGLATLLVGAGAAIGYYYGGVLGLVAGSLFGGSATNAYRAYSYYRVGGDETDREAKVSGTYAVLAAAVAGYLAVKHVKPRTAVANPDGPDDSDPDEPSEEPEEPTSCGIRPVGP